LREAAAGGREVVGGPLYDGAVPLRLIAGPANAGKVELLLDRYLAALEREPVLIVPNRPDVERVQRRLLARRPALLAGTLGTFDDLFERIAGVRRPMPASQRSLLVRRVLASAQLDRLAASARFGGFADALLQAISEVESGLLDPAHLDGDLAALHAAYRAELERLELLDRGALRRRAVGRLRSDLDAWHGEPVFAYGFEDLTGAEVRYLVEQEWAETAEDVLWRRTKLGLKATPDERIAINQFIVSLARP